VARRLVGRQSVEVRVDDGEALLHTAVLDGSGVRAARYAADALHGSAGKPRARRSNAAKLRQIAAWEASGAKVFPRALRYPKDWPAHPAEEKGVDVELAVDLVFNAARQNYDVAVVVSTDTDLVPALQAVCNLSRALGKPRVERAAWECLRKRLRVPEVPLWCQSLTQAQYETVRDDTSYTKAL